MILLPDLSGLDEAAKDALIRAQALQIASLVERISELEARLGGPPKTPDNSSIPPSKGQKPNRAERRAVARRKGARAARG